MERTCGGGFAQRDSRFLAIDLDKKAQFRMIGRGVHSERQKKLSLPMNGDLQQQMGDQTRRSCCLSIRCAACKRVLIVCVNNIKWIGSIAY